METPRKLIGNPWDILHQPCSSASFQSQAHAPGRQKNRQARVWQRRGHVDHLAAGLHAVEDLKAGDLETGIQRAPFQGLLFEGTLVLLCFIVSLLFTDSHMTPTSLEWRGGVCLKWRCFSQL